MRSFGVAQVKLERCEKSREFEAEFHFADVERPPSQCYVEVEDFMQHIFQVRSSPSVVLVRALKCALGLFRDSYGTICFCLQGTLAMKTRCLECENFTERPEKFLVRDKFVLLVSNFHVDDGSNCFCQCH